ncbi:hypothetical protein CC2G_009993 [Coprinopsis cinerea AmutBmut pab1-1]|nr:hypothetical protein CC2G_009993 [Coprinopsis cinerea AmutBmut pab1-1]
MASSDARRSYIDSRILYHEDEARRLMKLLQDRIRDLKTERNELAPISRCPPEVLCNIFSQLKRSVEDDYDSKRASSRMAWIVASRVCRHWRAVVLRSPSLWTDISTRNSPEWIKTALSRPRGAALCVHIDLTPYRADRFLPVVEDVLDKSSTIQSLELSIGPKYTQTTFPHLTAPTPMLQSALIMMIPPDQRLGIIYGKPVALPVNLFGNEAPNLRVLHLKNCDYPWTSSLFSNLTSLKVDLSNCSPSDVPTHPIEELLSALIRMPTLVRLYLSTIRLNGTPRITARLPHLSELELDLMSQNTALLLLHLQIPPSVKAYLSFREADKRSRGLIPAALRTLKSSASDLLPATSELLGCQITCNGQGSLVVEGWTSPHGKRWDDAKLRVHVWNTGSVPISISQIAFCLPLHAVERLTLDGWFNNLAGAEASWLFANFLSVRELDISSFDNQGDLVACLKDDPAFAVPSAPRTYLPLLQKCVFGMALFVESHQRMDDFEVLWSLRAQRGARLKTLDIGLSGMPHDHEMVPRLREVVDEVDTT